MEERVVEERVVELELRLMQQQDLVQQLSDVLAEQQKELSALKSEVALLRQRLQAEPGLVDAADGQRPPHY